MREFSEGCSDRPPLRTLCARGLADVEGLPCVGATKKTTGPMQCALFDVAIPAAKFAEVTGPTTEACSSCPYTSQVISYSSNAICLDLAKN